MLLERGRQTDVILSYAKRYKKLNLLAIVLIPDSGLPCSHSSTTFNMQLVPLTTTFLSYLFTPLSQRRKQGGEPGIRQGSTW